MDKSALQPKKTMQKLQNLNALEYWRSKKGSSRTSMRFLRFLSQKTAVFFGAWVLLATLGCSENWVSGRDVLRVGAYRVEPQPMQVQRGEPPKILARKSVLRLVHRADLAAEMQNAFMSSLPEGVSEEGASREVLRLQKCKLKVALGKQHTLYEARCRAGLWIDDVVLVFVDARAYRRARSKALPKGTRAEKDGKNPYVDDVHVREVLLNAARTAGKLILNRKNKPPPLDEKMAFLDEEIQRQYALKNLSSEDAGVRVGAVIDLGNYGLSEDAKLLVPLLDDKDALVRRAAVMALAEMAVVEEYAELASRCSWGGLSQQKMCQKGVERMRVQDPDLVKMDVKLEKEPVSEGGRGERKIGVGLRTRFFESEYRAQKEVNRRVLGQSEDELEENDEGIIEEFEAKKGAAFEAQKNLAAPNNEAELLPKKSSE